MRKLILITLFAFASVAGKCQMTSNIITPTEFNNIKINNVRLGDIVNANGVESEMQSLFGTPISKAIEKYYYSRYYYNGFKISFSSVVSGNPNEPILGSFHITNNNYSITIKGRTITIGDHTSKLGFVKVNNRTDGKRGIIYQACVGCNNFISIVFDETTYLITEIYYIELT